ncbi:DUF3558 domain-containing protein [Streptomyces arenae]|uniref:DUF3558 domain-containing protein n=1 Tax=Streptomyces arenae TaxID=29301 RepID=UPI00265A3FD3|nr:DUF3558 domain-containing protein [Streptomyces arenae]MCG7210764.1 DUF3558 domain-containing protein [Streptomyces arenae]
MQRKAYVTGTAALLAALLAGCTSGSSGGDDTSDKNADTGTATVAAQPGKYRTLPEPCGAVSHDTLDSLLPGIAQITDTDQRDKAYQGDATLTYDTDRKVGCRWKVESTDATDRLSVDFERVVSYDNSVSDDNEAQTIYSQLETAADIPESAPPSATESPSPSGSSSASASPSASSSAPSSASASASASSGDPAGSASASASSSVTPADLQPRVLTDLGDEAYLDDQLSGSGSTAEQRTVTVVFRTSNVVVTIEYEEQPMATGTVPDSKEMQDRAQNLAAQLAEALNG